MGQWIQDSCVLPLPYPTATPVRSSLIFKQQRFGRWSISGNTPSNINRRAPTPEGEGEDREIQFLSPIPSSPPYTSRPGSSQDNYPDLTSMMSSFVAHTSPHGHQRKGSQVSSDEENLWEDSGSIYSSAVAAGEEGRAARALQCTSHAPSPSTSLQTLRGSPQRKAGVTIPGLVALSGSCGGSGCVCHCSVPPSSRDHTQPLKIARTLSLAPLPLLCSHASPCCHSEGATLGL